MKTLVYDIWGHTGKPNLCQQLLCIFSRKVVLLQEPYWEVLGKYFSRRILTKDRLYVTVK